MDKPPRGSDRRSKADRREEERRTGDRFAADSWRFGGGVNQRSGVERRSGKDRREIQETEKTDHGA